MPDQTAPADTTVRGYRAVETIYHAYLTGLILTVVTRRGRADAAELLFRTFRRQHLEKFLPGLDKLGLRGLPDAVAAAQYHYLSNHLGGVRVEYMYESDRKAWVRYVPPRWIYEGTAICGIPSEASRAMLRGWHAHNGVTLGNPRLGFVCTKQTVDGQPGLEGYTTNTITIWRPTNASGSRRARTAPTSTRPPRRVSRGPIGRRNAFRRCSATTRWSTSGRSCPSWWGSLARPRPGSSAA